MICDQKCLSVRRTISVRESRAVRGEELVELRAATVRESIGSVVRVGSGCIGSEERRSEWRRYNGRGSSGIEGRSF